MLMLINVRMSVEILVFATTFSLSVFLLLVFVLDEPFLEMSSLLTGWHVEEIIVCLESTCLAIRYVLFNQILNFGRSMSPSDVSVLILTDLIQARGCAPSILPADWHSSRSLEKTSDTFPVERFYGSSPRESPNDHRFLSPSKKEIRRTDDLRHHLRSRVLTWASPFHNSLCLPYNVAATENVKDIIDNTIVKERHSLDFFSSARFLSMSSTWTTWGAEQQQSINHSQSSVESKQFATDW